MKPTVERDRAGNAVAVSVSCRVGDELVRFTEPVERGEMQVVALLRAEAEVLRRALDARAADDAKFIRPGFPSLEEWFTHWRRARYELGLWGRGISASGSESDIDVLWRYIPERYRSMAVDSITPATAQRIVDDVHATRAATTVATFGIFFASMMRDAVKYGWEDGSGHAVPWRARRDVGALLRLPKPTTLPRPTLDVDALTAVIDASRRRHGDTLHWTTRVIAFMAVLGLRVDEASALRWEQITLTPGGDVHGFITWRPEERKAGEPHRMPIPHALAKYLPPPASKGAVFTPLSYFRRVRYVNAELRAAAADAGLDPTMLSSHRLRHSFAHAAYRRAGAVTADVSRALGHASEATTKRYLRGVDDARRVDAVVDAHSAEVMSS
jgi:integrase